MKRNLMFCHMGNGISVADKLHQEYGDYQAVAHISSGRCVSFKIDLDSEYREEIISFAAFEDPKVSHTQSGKVFYNAPPLKTVDEVEIKEARHGS